MDLYAIHRRGAWADSAELEAADARSNEEAHRRTDRLRKIRSYLHIEPDGRLGSVCYYQANSEDDIREHARAADVPVTEILRITAFDVQRPDPELQPT